MKHFADQKKANNEEFFSVRLYIGTNLLRMLTHFATRLPASMSDCTMRLTVLKEKIGLC